MTARLASPQSIVEAALSAATADGTIVIVVDRSEANLRWANSSLTTNGEMSSRSVTVISTVDVRSGTGGPNASGTAAGTASGVVSRSIAGPEQVRQIVEAAEATARSSDPAVDAAPLVTPEESGWGSDFQLPPQPTSIGALDRLAGDLGEVMGAAGPQRQHFGFAEHVIESVYLGSSTGLRLRHVQPTGRLEMNAKNRDWSSSSYLGFSMQDPSEADVRSADAELATRLGWAETSISLEAGRYETILPPTTLADLLIYAYWLAEAQAADEGRSAYSRRIGDRVAALPIDIFSDPAYPGVHCSPFAIIHASGPDQSVFDNGLPLGREHWVRDGLLAGLNGSRAYAVKSADGGHHTPVHVPGDNLVLQGRSSDGVQASLEDLVASTRRGLLLSTLWYIRLVDPQSLLLTGLTRDGVYLIEDGEVRGAVNNFRFNESPLGVLGRITEIGRTERCYPREWGDYFTRTAMPPVRVADFNMSTVSLAQ